MSQSVSGSLGAIIWSTRCILELFLLIGSCAIFLNSSTIYEHTMKSIPRRLSRNSPRWTDMPLKSVDKWINQHFILVIIGTQLVHNGFTQWMQILKQLCDPRDDQGQRNSKSVVASRASFLSKKDFMNISDDRKFCWLLDADWLLGIRW